MSSTLVVGLDGQDSGERALAFAKRMAKLIGDCELVLVFVVEWSPYSFQTAEENAKRGKARKDETDMAMARIIAPAVDRLKKEGIETRGLVRHGNVANILNAVSVEEKAEQIIVSRSSDSGLATRLFGSSTSNLVMGASVPVTVVG